MKKKYILIALCMMALCAGVVLVLQTSLKDDETPKDLEYRTERDAFVNNLQNLPDFTECYWKAAATGNTRFGPTNYWIRGFVCLDENTFQKIIGEYDWIPVSVSFPDGISPSITGRNDFDWSGSKAYETTILQQNFVGNIYLDTTNGILYLDVENA